jgi:cardiolipin synthase A/B
MSIQSIAHSNFFGFTGHTKQKFYSRRILQMWIALLVVGILFLLAGADFYFGHKKMTGLESKPVTANGQMEFLSTGYHFFDALFQDIKKANRYIMMQFYIFRDDELGLELCKKLQEKAAEGVKIYLLVDRLGSRGLKKDTILSLKKAGIHFLYSRKPEFPFFLYRINHRNHRKITVFDGETGYLGGYNVGNEYLGKDAKLGDWRDYHLKLKGHVVQNLQSSFEADWKMASEEGPENFTKSEIIPTYNTDFLLVGSHGRTAYYFFLDKIKQSKKSIFIGSPYFIPGKKLNRALLEALKRGVSITLLLPMKPDHALVQEASYRYLKPLLEAGAVIYQFHEGFYHSKVYIFDESICDVGTANFDFRSFFFNDEINCIFTEPSYIQEVKKVIESDLARSEKLTLDTLKKTRTLWVRLKEGVAFAISPFM